MLESIITFITESVDWMASLVFILGYLGIFLLMFLESSFIPFPSEVVLIPAGVLVAKGEMNFFMALVAGTGGSLAGAYLNYYLARLLGRPTINALLERYGKLFFIKGEDIRRSEAFFHKHGYMATFTGRLIPVIRQLISLPAGFYHMPLIPFSILTIIGAGIWSGILLGAGFLFQENRAAMDENLLMTKLLLLLGITVLVTGYIAWQYRRRLLPHHFRDDA